MNILANLYDLARLAFRNGITHNGKRDLYECFGYTLKPTIADYRGRYERGDIAGRLVDAYPDACWNHPPIAIEDEDEDDMTTWETEVSDFLKLIDFWETIHRADILAQLGKYSCIFIGFGDSDLTQPARKNVAPTYLMALAEDTCLIHSKVLDPKDKRFGQPAEYKVKVEGAPDLIVHHSRILHIADRAVLNPLEGASILERVLNRLEDLEKVVGSSAEIWWLNGRGGLSIETQGDTEMPADMEPIKQKVEEYQNKLSRTMFLGGMTAKPINHQIPDPKPNAEILLAIISGSTSIPQRILLGSERGELASGQDATEWNNRIEERRTKFCEPKILNAFLDRMIELGVVKKPKNPYKWEWPELETLSKKDKAEVGLKKAQALVAYANSPEADKIIPPRQFVEDIINLPYREDEIEDILDEEAKQMEEDAKRLAENPDLAPPSLPPGQQPTKPLPKA